MINISNDDVPPYPGQSIERAQNDLRTPAAFTTLPVTACKLEPVALLYLGGL